MIHMPRLPNPSSIALFFLALYACVSATSQRPACADNQYRQAMAKAVRNAAKREDYGHPILRNTVNVQAENQHGDRSHQCQHDRSH